MGIFFPVHKGSARRAAFVVACRLFFILLALMAAVPLLGRLSEAPEGPNLPTRLVGFWRQLLVLGSLNSAHGSSAPQDLPRPRPDHHAIRTRLYSDLHDQFGVVSAGPLGYLMRNLKSIQAEVRVDARERTA